jgi:hypothetical protein
VSDAGVGDDPLAAGDVDVIADEPARRAQREQRERGTARRQLVAIVASEARQHAKLEQKRAAARRARDIDFATRHAVSQVHRAVRYAGRRVKRRQQPLGQVDGEAQQCAVVANEIRQWKRR